MKKENVNSKASNNKKGSRIKKILLVMGLVLLILSGAALYWINDGYDPMEEALGSLEASKEVAVDIRDRWIHFQPAEDMDSLEERTGFIYYPGARVDHRSYGPLMHALAREGVEGFLVAMPLDLAILGSNRAEDIMDQYREIDRWIIGGHSLGGAMAARFTYNHRELVEGLVLFASYPASSNDLSDFQNLSVLSIYGDLDGFVTAEDINNSEEYVPGNTQWLEIEGGNHSQFGYYGFQRGDLEAKISREEQHDQIIEGIMLWLEAAGE